MIKITLTIDGMACGMCESHVNNVLRRNFQVKKVVSSHARHQTEIITEQDIEEEALKAAVCSAGYQVRAIQKEPYEKKGIFSAFRK